MDTSRLYSDISKRTQGDIYIGVVGPVRSGKSTFIKKFMETLVIPNIQNEFQRERAVDELPQSAAGRTIMTAEPKFIPDEAVRVDLSDNASFRVKMIDCVGYIVPSALGYIENDMPRMVMTPWFEKPVPFNMAAEIGTKKVITDHSTIGLVITTDGSFGELPRGEYEEAEQRVIAELTEIGKPFVVVLNCFDPAAADSRRLADAMEQKYGVPVLPVNCLELAENDIKDILETILFEFPVKEIGVNIPTWIEVLDEDNEIKRSFYSTIMEQSAQIQKVKQIRDYSACLTGNEYITEAQVKNVDLGRGSAVIDVQVRAGLFYEVLAQATGLDIKNEGDLMLTLTQLSRAKAEYDKYASAIMQAQTVGYGIVTPATEELTLEEPELIKQGGRYGIRLKAAAPSIHMIRADIETEVSPIVGTEKQSEDLITDILREYEDNPAKIWESDIFGKSLYDLVNDGMLNKLYKMPGEAREKMQETLQRVINEGSDGLICIIL